MKTNITVWLAIFSVDLNVLTDPFEKLKTQDNYIYQFCAYERTHSFKIE